MIGKKLPADLYFLIDTEHLLPISRSQSNLRSGRRSASTMLGIAITLVLSACGGGGGIAEPLTAMQPVGDDPNPTLPLDPNSCEIAAQNQWVYDNMLDYYLFYDQVPQVDPQSYSTSEELLRATRFEERDPYSYIADASTSALRFDEGRTFGLGYRWGRDDDDAPRLISVANDSPFGRAGLERGDIIVSVNDILWNEFPGEEFTATVVGSPDAPVTSIWKIEKRDTGEIVEVQITTAEYAINTVLHKQYFINANYNGKTGYLAFSAFLNTSREELNAVFEEFNNSNITDLVLDLRYNGGGRISIAEHLASLIAGNSQTNKVLYDYKFNDKYTTNNFSLNVQNNVGDLGLSRVIILTRGNTASASEIVISGLKPHMEVVTIGSTTSGKPYIQSGRNRCGRQLNAIEAEGINAVGVSVFGGIPATCYAADDRTRNFGIDVETGKLEGMLESALDYVVYGDCQTVLPQAEQPTLQARTRLLERQTKDDNDKQGMVEIIGAFR
ncbi:S41 family peptidase [Granulosicoccus sp.]|nr:S41 family peptidase [Granulosicoccus sp.]MDB4223180.1 S41 family peptidase [Granulosicoccus sp.]